MNDLQRQPLQSEIRRIAREIENGLSCDKVNQNYVEMLMKFKEFVCDVEFSRLKHIEGIASSDLARAKRVFRQFHYSRCCSRLLNSLSVEVVSKYSKANVQSLERIFMDGPATQAITVLCTTISKSGLGFKLHKCVSLLETLLTEHKLAEIFWEQSVLPLPEYNDLQLQDQLTTTIVSLPETVTNKLQKETGEMFYPQSYVPLVCGDIYRTLEKARGCLVAGSDCSLEFVSKVLGRLALAGHADRVWGCLLPLLYPKVHSDYIWCRVCERIITGVPTRCLESALTPFLKQLPWYGLAGKFLGDSIVKNLTIQNLLCTKLLFHRHFHQILVVQNIIGYLATSHTRRKLYLKVLLSLLEVWGDASSIKHTSYEQHHYISQAVLICVGHLNLQEKETYKDELVRLLMPGVSCHIGHSDPKMRRLGMKVAEVLTRHVDPGGPQLNFQSESDAEIAVEIDALLVATAIPEEPSIEALDRMLGKTVISESLPLPAAAPSEASQPPQSVVDSDLDSDDDLQPFDMSHDVVQTKVKAPKYVRDCMEGLISTDDVDRVDVCLQEAETLIRRNPDGLHEIAAEFSKVLLHLSDSASYSGFITRRFAAMVALAVQCPKQVADFLTQEFYERNYNLRQRMDILEVVVAAATELSKPSPSFEQAAHRKVEEMPHSSQADGASWRDIVEKRIESKTRRFARGRSQPLPQPVTNKFAPVAGHFFYPLMKNFDRKENTFDLLGEDTLVLGRLVYSLGMILYAALHAPASGQMGRSLLQFTWSLRFHSDVFVRQAVLFATSMIILVVPCHSLISDLQVEVTEMKLWLEGLMDRDPDSECRKLALQALVLLGNVVKQELHTES